MKTTLNRTTLLITLFTVYSNLNAQNVFQIREMNGVTYVVHEYRQVGTYSFIRPAGVSEIDILVIAGGGAGGGGNVSGGGGGAGEFIERTGFFIASNATVTVGNGGNGGTGRGASGQNSVFGSLTAIGGGGGGGSNNAIGLTGGSGGGSATTGGNGNVTNGANSIASDGLGNGGGSSYNRNNSSQRSAGGGGGANQTGANGSQSNNGIGGNGGNGRTSIIFGGAHAAGGGGAGGTTAGTGGTPGGGGGGNTSGNGGSAAANTGSGGGGSNGNSGGNGGSGIVIIRYRLSDVTGIITGNFTVEDSIEIENKIGFNGNLTLRSNTAITVLPDNALSISGNLILEDNTEITLKADSTGNYAMLKFDGDYIGGTNTIITQEQYFSGGWHMIGAPMNATTAGFFGNIGIDANGANSNTQNLFTWDGEAYINIGGNDSAVTPGQGYIGFVGQLGIHDSAGTYSFQGTPNTSIAGRSLEYLVSTLDPTDMGWNLLSNPFTCALKFSSINFTNVDNAFYINNPSGGTALNYISFSPAGIGSDTIAPLQSFWVRANNLNPSIGTLTMQSNGVVPDQSPIHYRSNIVDRIVLKARETNNPNFSDMTVLAFVDQTSDDFDLEWDALKLMNTGSHPSIYSAAGTDLMANNAIDFNPSRVGTKLIDVALRAPKNGQNYTIELDSSYLTNNYSILLEDKKTNTFHNLKTGNYTFQLDVNFIDRFALHISSNSLSNEKQISPPQLLHAWVFDGKAYFQPYSDLGVTNITLTDMSGKTLLYHNAELRKDSKYILDLPLIRSGMYLLRIQGHNTIRFFQH